MNQIKLKKLKQIIKEMESLLIAYSGGVDSTFLLKIAQETLGDKVLAVTAKSKIYPEREYEEAKRITQSLGVKHLTITTKELSNPHFSRNFPQRCYYCKKGLFTQLLKIAKKKGIRYIAEGTNYDDLEDFRPGIKALQEAGIRSPLKEAGLGKREIRLLSKKMDLPTWDKPASVCFASRFPYGEKITPRKVRMVKEAEDYLFNLGIKELRVRHHKDIARIEVSSQDITLLSQKAWRKKVVERFKEIGYHYVALDLQGYRRGSMNEVLQLRV